MRSRKDIIWNLWHSHEGYIGQQKQHVSLPDLTTAIGNLFCPGPFYYYVINSPTLEFEFVSDSVRELLGYEPADCTLASFIDIIHPDDLDFFYRCEDVVAWFLKNRVTPQQMTRYKICYCLRERMADGQYKLFLLQTVTLKVDNKGALLKVFGSHTDVSHLMPENSYRLSLVGLEGEPSYINLDVFSRTVLDTFIPVSYQTASSPFSQRELQIIRLLANGMDTSAIAETLHISPQTVTTHRKKILKKSGCANTNRLVAECVRHGYI